MDKNSTTAITNDTAKLLLEAYVKVLKINITNDTFKEIRLDTSEIDESHGYSNKISKWLNDFATKGNVYIDDLRSYLCFTDFNYINSKLDSGLDKISIRYRRKYADGFKWSRMTLIKSEEYTDDNRVLILYIEDINDDIVNANKISSQNETILEQYRITASLMGMYFICLYVDINDDKYKKVYVDSSLNSYFKEAGSMHDVVNMLRNELIIPNQQESFDENFSIEKIKEMLGKQSSFDYEYWAKKNEETICCRISAILVDKNEDLTPHHILITMQDVTATAEATKRTNAILKDAFNASLAATNVKSEFLSRMSHDMRTPLNGIIGMTAIAGSHIDEKERLQDCLAKITGASKHLLSLINDILDLSKIESGKFTLTNDEFNLSECLDETIDLFNSQIKDNDINLCVYVNNVKNENVIGDQRHLEEVFNNLISNAIKYTPSGGTIKVSLNELPSKSNNIGMYEFICEDNGYGMSEEFVQKLFDPFERASDERVIKQQGTGLGMSIVKNIVNTMGGSIAVKSKLNEGSTFTVTFELKLQEAQNLKDDDLVNLPVLVVDDDKLTCEGTCAILKDLGMKDDFALSGEEAVNKVVKAHQAKDDYFVCLIDWKMPNMDGFETTRKIREIVGRDVTIVIMSAYDWEDIESEALKAGADGFIAKPLFKSRLKNAFTGARNTKINRLSNDLKSYKEKDYSKSRVLLVEDNDLNREIAKELITSTGCKVECAENGLVALDMFKKNEENYYDLIIMDVSMPVMDGYTSTKEIRSSNKKDAKTVPIIALSANAFIDDVKASKDAGMNEHLSKPIELNRLLEVLNKYLK